MAASMRLMIPEGIFVALSAITLAVGQNERAGAR
jgi:hypothetical protein